MEESGGTAEAAQFSVPSTLQKIRRLELDFKTFEEQLEQIPGILGIDAILEPDYALFEDYGVELQPLFPGRNKWAIGWILQKLKKDEACSSLRGWTLLGNLILILSLPAIASNLAAYHFVSVLLKALEKSFPAAGPITFQNGKAQDTSDPRYRLPGDDHMTENEHRSEESNSRKRKTSGESRGFRKTKKVKVEDSSDSDSDDHTRQNHYFADLFVAITVCVDRIVNLATQTLDSEKLRSVRHLQSHLRMDSTEAARSLGSWLRAMLLAIRSRQRTKKMQVIFNGPVSWYSGILYLWNSRSNEMPDDPAWSPRLFSEYCLLPAVLLLHHTKNSMSDNSGDVPAAPVSQMVEKLLARFVFAPARRQYRSLSHNSGSDNEVSTNALNLENLMRSLRMKLLLEDTQTDNADQKKLSASIPLLFGIGISCTPLSTPKRKVEESKWIQTLFIALQECLGFRVSGAARTTRLMARLHNLEEMLQITLSQDIKLSSSLLIGLLSYSNISGGAKSSIRWKLIENILSMDSDLFIKGSLSDDIFNSITDHGWMICGPRSQPDERTTQFLTIRDDITIPLMNAYTKSRDLLGFLTKWKLSMVSIEQRFEPSSEELVLNNNTSHRFVWEDTALSRKLKEIIELNMTPGQISSFLKALVDEIQEKLANHHDTTKKSISASLAIATAIFYALKSDQILADMHHIAKQMFVLCLSIISEPHAKFLEVNLWSWRCMRQAYRVWSYILNGSQIIITLDKEASRIFDLADITLKVAYQSHLWKEILIGAEAFACIGSIATSLYQLHAASDKVRLLVHSLMGSLSHATSHKGESIEMISEARLHLMGVLLSEYPTILCSAQRNERFEILETLLDLGIRCDSTIPVQSFSNWESVTLNALKIGEAKLSEDIVLHVANSFKSCHRSVRPQIGAVVLQMPVEILPLFEIDDFNYIISEEDQNLSTPGSNLIILNLLLRFLEDTSERQKLLPNMITLWEWAGLLDSRLSHLNSATLQIFGAVVFAELKSFEQSVGSKTATAKFSLLVEKVQHLVKRVKTYVGIPFQLKAVDVILQVLGKLAQASLVNYTVEEWKNLQRLHFAILRNDLMSVETEKDTSKIYVTRLEFEAILESLTGLDVSIIAEDPLFQSQMTSLLSSAEQGLHNKTNKIFQMSQYSAMLRIESKIGNDSVQLPNLDRYRHALGSIEFDNEEDDSDSECVKTPSIALSPEHQFSILKSFRENLAILDRVSQSDLIDKLSREPAARPPHLAELRLLREVIRSFREDFCDRQDLLPRCAMLLGKTDLFEEFVILSDIVDRMLHSKAKLVSQFGVDVVLTEVRQLCSPGGPKLPPKQSAYIFTRLCKLVLTILTLCRRHIQDRHHLLIPVLQALLNCLFNFDQPEVVEMRHPPWILSATSNTTPKQALIYVRVLTTFCEPTPASVRYRSKGKNGSLTDHTRRAREIVGRFAPLVITEFCYAQLNGGKLGPGIRTALMPGIYALFGAVEMTNGILETTNAGLSAAGRAVFRSTYDEYKRVGKWKEGHGT